MSGADEYLERCSACGYIFDELESIEDDDLECADVAEWPDIYGS